MSAIEISLAGLAASTQQAWDNWHLEGGWEDRGSERGLSDHGRPLVSRVFFRFQVEFEARSLSLRGFWGCGEGLERKIGVYPSCVVREAGFKEGIWWVYRVVVAQTSG